MAYGITNMRRIQFGQENPAAPGTPVVATARWRGPGAQIDSGKVVVRPPENVGLLFDTDRAYIPSQLATLDIPETEATFEQILYMLNGGVKGIVTGVADGTGSGKIYDFTWDEAGTNVIQPFTIEAGDNNAAAEMEYAVCTEFTLTWAAREGLKVASKWAGRQRTATTFTSIAALPTVEEILTPTIAIDTVAGTIGGTVITGTLLGYELTVQTGVQPLFTGEGQTYFGTVKYVKPSGVLRLTYEHDANASAEYAAFIAKTPRCVRILHLGTALSQGSGAYAAKRFMVDMCGVYTSFPPFEDQDGDNIITCELGAAYNATEDLFMRFLDVCALAAVV